MKLFQFGRLEKRIVVFFVGLLMFVQMAGFLAISYAIEQNARRNLREELNVGARVFKRLLDQKEQQLVSATNVLTRDFAFRGAIATRDRDTIVDVLKNHGSRISANRLALVDMTNIVAADTVQPARIGKPFAFPDLINAAAGKNTVSAIRIIDGTIYQLVIVPVLAPVPIAWVVIGFVIDNATASDLKVITGLDVSFFGADQTQMPKIFATTLNPDSRANLQLQAPDISTRTESSAAIVLGHEEYEILATTIDRYQGTGGNGSVFAVLQRSVRDGLQPYETLKLALLFLAGVSLLVTLAGSIRIARRITRPVRKLALAARQVAAGNYGEPIVLKQNDEIGELATAFNNMSKGLTERDQVRDILGKVASHEVAEQLLKQNIELGGEERDVTVLFTDIRNFTALCENHPPALTIGLLNRYLTAINAIVDEYEGVIDKYTGDGVMALFGAPIGRTDDPQRAVRAAIAIDKRMRELAGTLASEQLPNPDVGIGVNTSRVVAGNIGSPTRLNYTVLGDGVNLASRFESLTKRYRVPLIVGETTVTQTRDLVYLELDKVRVIGKSKAVRIFQPLGSADQLDAGMRNLVDRHHRALALFRARSWNAAEDIFRALAPLPGYARIAAIYLDYLNEFFVRKPADDWDGAFTLSDK
ncbi:MAG: HAMP domain-containing protein [Burkholderiales bacterium]|nr:HAMP domain-containing protein [Burkholderiales bacterium]